MTNKTITDEDDLIDLIKYGYISIEHIHRGIDDIMRSFDATMDTYELDDLGKPTGMMLFLEYNVRFPCRGNNLHNDYYQLACDIRTPKISKKSTTIDFRLDYRGDVFGKNRLKTYAKKYHITSSKQAQHLLRSLWPGFVDRSLKKIIFHAETFLDLARENERVLMAEDLARFQDPNLDKIKKMLLRSKYDLPYDTINPAQKVIDRILAVGDQIKRFDRIEPFE